MYNRSTNTICLPTIAKIFTICDIRINTVKLSSVDHTFLGIYSIQCHIELADKHLAVPQRLYNYIHRNYKKIANSRTVWWKPFVDLTRNAPTDIQAGLAGVLFNIICVARGWVGGVQIPGKNIMNVYDSPLFVLRGDEWGGGVCQISRKKALRKCTFHHYLCYEGMSGDPGGGCQICRKKALRKCTFHRYLCYEGMSGGGGVKIPGNKHYECVSYTFICVTRG